MKRRPCLVLPAWSALGGLGGLGALPGPSHAQGPGLAAAPPLKRVTLLGVTENLAPLNYLDGGRPRGFAVDLLKALAAGTGATLEVRVLPWPRALRVAEGHDHSLLFSLVRLPEREERYQWVGPIAPRRVFIYKLARRRDLQLSRLEDLGSARIGVVRDSATDRLLQAQGLRPGRELDQGLDDAANLRKLLAGRMEFVTLLDWAALWAMRQLKQPYATLEPVMELDPNRSYWYGLQPDADPSIARGLQAELDAMRRDGRYDRLHQRHFR